MSGIRNHRPRPLKDTTYRYPIELEVQVAITVLLGLLLEGLESEGV